MAHHAGRDVGAGDEPVRESLAGLSSSFVTLA
jgi:hypothetical protein